MPARTKNKGNALGIGAGVQKRTAKQKPVRKGRATSPAVPAIIADSFRTLRLKPIPGTKVTYNLGVQYSSFSCIENDDFSDEKLLQDLHEQAAKYHELAGADFLLKDASSMTGSEKLAYTLEVIKQATPEDFRFNVDRFGDEYHLTIYKVSDASAEFYSFEVGVVLPKLKRYNKKLYEVFLQFLKCLYQNLDIYPWWWLFGDTLDWMCDRVGNMPDEEDYDPELAQETNSYKHGEPAYYEKLLMKLPSLPIYEVKEKALKFPVSHPIVKMMVSGCELLEKGYGWQHFDYEAIPTEEMDDYYLRLEHQIGIVWRYDDMVFGEFEERINNDANNGIQDSIYGLSIKRRKDPIDFDEIRKICDVPREMQLYMYQAQQLIEEYNEPKNRKPAKRRNA